MRIEHTALYVRDLEAARTFFVTYLQAVCGDKYHNPRTGFQSYFLSFDGGARLEIMTRPDLALGSSQPCTGYAHLAFSLGSREAVDALTARLAADGYTILSGPRTTGDGYYESCVEIMEGSWLELTV
ncbi:MAG: VOC family protein [Clostridia bacterium]|nr:VOC family protein [Clostridia bacterium]